VITSMQSRALTPIPVRVSYRYFTIFVQCPRLKAHSSRQIGCGKNPEPGIFDTEAENILSVQRNANCYFCHHCRDNTILTVSSQNRSSSAPRLRLSRLTSQRPPSLLCSSSHIGCIPSCKFVTQLCTDHTKQLKNMCARWQHLPSDAEF